MGYTYNGVKLSLPTKLWEEKEKERQKKYPYAVIMPESSGNTYGYNGIKLPKLPHERGNG